MPLPNTSPDMSPTPTTVISSVSISRPSSRKWRLTSSQAPREVMPIALWSYPAEPPEANASQPVSAGLGDGVGKVGEGGGALVGGDDEIGVVTIMSANIFGRRHAMAAETGGPKVV